MLVRLSDTACGEAVRECATGVEFWAQRRSLAAPMHLHWDCDEKLGGMTGLLVCPLLSVILYVGDEGGPTLMIARSPADEGPSSTLQPPERCWLVWPHAGQIASFAGSMLHAVLRQDGATATPLAPWPPAPTGEEQPARMRTTVLVEGRAAQTRLRRRPTKASRTREAANFEDIGSTSGSLCQSVLRCSRRSSGT